MPHSAGIGFRERARRYRAGRPALVRTCAYLFWAKLPSYRIDPSSVYPIGFIRPEQVYMHPFGYTIVYFMEYLMY